MKNAISETIGLLPPQSRVGIMTFGEYVSIYDLYCCSESILSVNEDISANFVPVSVVFRSQSSPEEFRKFLDLPPVKIDNNIPLPFLSSSTGMARYFVPFSVVEFSLMSILNSIKSDGKNPEGSMKRQPNCFGLAFDIASTLMECCCYRTGGRLFAFIGAPCTVGPGIITDLNGPKRMRTHYDLENDTSCIGISTEAKKV
jgi:protein transport protein SEC23